MTSQNWNNIAKRERFRTKNQKILPAIHYTLAPIWLPHCPAWRWTISRILIDIQRAKNSNTSSVLFRIVARGDSGAVFIEGVIYAMYVSWKQ